MTSLTLFKDMLVDDNVVPDIYTYTFVLKACANVGCVSVGQQVYGHVVKTGADGDWYICNTLIRFYAKNTEFGDARKDAVSWNVIITGYARNREFTEVFRLYEDMWKDGVVRDDYNFVNVLSGCTSVSGLSQGEWIHAYVDKNKIEVGESLLWVLAEVTLTLKWQSVFNDVTKLRKKMRAQGVSKDPVCSMIEVNGVLHEFQAGEGMVL
ncbi:pentatricopeptide repeat-containing protein [Tanacetum coccineum]